MDQDEKRINVSGTAARKSGAYSIEFHEDHHYAQVKRANPDGSATYFSLNSAGPATAARYENYSDSGSARYTALQGIETPLVLDGQGPFEDKRFSPEWLSHDLYNPATGKITLTEVPIGTLIHITYDLRLVPTSSNENVRIYLKFGTFGGYKMYLTDTSMRQQNEIHFYSGSKTFFVINEELQQNGVELVVETECDTEIIPSFLMIAII